MDVSKRIAFLVCSLTLGMLLFVAACGSNGGSTGSGSGNATTPVATAGTTSTSTPDTSGYGSGKYGSGGQATPTTSGAKTPTTSGAKTEIKTATVTVSGKAETVLTDAQGKTLYYRTSDAPPTSVCSGGCASAWPPIVVTGSSAPASSTTLPGKLSVQMTANGEQVEYNGHPLYTFAGDSGPGQANGEGVGGVWFVVTPGLH